jgi:3-deoxy-D-manno-octulosonic-acid transferase
LDFAFAVRACLRTLNPQLLILVEGELWPRLLCECARAGLPVAVVNARVSDRSFRRTYPLRSLWLPMARKITLFLAQSHETAERLRLLGVAESSIQTPGNLKRDPIPANGGAPPNRMARRIADSIGEARLLVCGSTHEGEEAILLAAWPTIQRELPDAMLLLAPRHPQRFTAVRALVEATGAPVLCCSQLPASQLPAGSTPIPPGTVLLLDTLGDLADVYGIASAAFIGGSLVARGGHNPLEATRFTLPVFLGPSFENFREVVRDLIAARELEVVTADTLARRLVSALRSGKAEIPAAAQTGATSRTVQALLRLLEDSGRRPRPETRA